MTETKLRVENLTTRFFTGEGQINAVESVSFDVPSGSVYGIVGESGSGKSVTAMSIIDLVESPGRIVDGEVWFHSPELASQVAESNPAAVDGSMVDLLQLDARLRRSLRGNEFSTIFQDPMSSFNPSITVGEQIAEAVEVQQRASVNPRSTQSRTQGYGLSSMVLDSVIPRRGYVNEASMDRAIELLELVGIPDPIQRAEEYPHQFSGGMLQRAMIAQALAGEPSVLVADEPTTALDVTIQAQVLDLLDELQEETGMTTILITHNLGVIARMADHVGVMYAGEIVETGTLSDIFEDAVHPYTQGLIGSIPDLDSERDRLNPIDGNVPSLHAAEMGTRCYFADRCPKAMERCLDKPRHFEVAGDHTAQCYLAQEDYAPDEALSEGFFDE